MDKKEIKISIVIPVKNGEFWLANLFNCLVQQSLFYQTEIIAIDSGSTDKSINIINQYPVTLVQIPPSEFNHGDTRNLGVRIAKGKYVVMTVQDAKPSNKFWLQHLLDGFINDNVAGVCGQQIVAHKKEYNPVDWFYPVNEPSIKSFHFKNREDFENLSGEEKKNICGWDDVTACYRRDLLLKLPFRKINFAEDLQWASDAILAGYTIVYNSFAQVQHYHDMNKDFAFKRSLTVFYYKYKIFGYIPKTISMNLKQHLQLIYLLIKRDVSITAKFSWWKYNINSYLCTKNAFKVFTKALKISENNLDSTYHSICSTPPQSQSKN
jgi:rhamnosyltransferase